MKNEKQLKSKRSDLPLIKPVAQVQDPVQTVVYGRPGTGKTTLAATWPKPLLLLDMNDKGTSSIADVKGVDVAQITDPKEIDAVYWMLKGGSKYKTVVFDTVSQMQQLIMEDVSDDREAGRWGVMRKSDWGDVSARMNQIIMDFRDLDMNVLFLAQERLFNIPDDDEGSRDALTPEIGPALIPSLGRTLNAAVSIIGQMFIRVKTETKKVGKKEIKRDRMVHSLYIGPNPVRTTKVRKTRKVVLPSYIEDPTYDDLMEVIKGE